MLATLPAGVHGVALEPCPGDPLLSSLLQSALAVQLLTLGLVGLAGTNPDLIRREERAYREAALYRRRNARLVAASDSSLRCGRLITCHG